MTKTKQRRAMLRIIAAAMVLSMATAPMTPVADFFNVGTNITVNAQETWTEVSTYNELVQAVAAGGNIRLTDNIDTNGGDVTIDKACIIDFNGKKLLSLKIDYITQTVLFQAVFLWY